MGDILGIDIGQKELVMHLVQADKRYKRTFRNHPDDFAALSKWLDKHKVKDLHVCIEATGAYWEAVAWYLHEAGHKVSVVNPARIYAHSKSLLRRNKTDQLDAELIAHFCAIHQPARWTPPSPELRQLRALVRLMDDLQEMRTQQINRLKSGVELDQVKQHLQQHIEYIEEQLKQVMAQIRQLIRADEQLSHDFDLLLSIPGIGEITAALFLAENIQGYRSARAITAHAGLNPSYHRSGTSVDRAPHISKLGSARLRKALYMPALSALQWNPCVKALGDRLQGRPRMVVVAAAMRKLLVLAFGVLKSAKPFDPNYANHQHLATA
jgi:transposase